MLIAITAEETLSDEYHRIERLLDAGFSYVHLRKPSYTIEEMRDYLSHIPTHLYPRLTLGTHYNLLDEFNLGGVHLSSQENREGVNIGDRRVSKSCHTIDELQCASYFDYVTLSPIFDSISNPSNYSQYDLEELTQMQLPDNVIALGGITANHLKQVEKIGFAGAALKGYLFLCDIETFNKRLSEIFD